MTKIEDLFDAELLERMLAEKYVRRQFHPEDADLAILNYAEKAQYEREWNAVTLASRGLIYRVSTGEVVARPFPKFFNWDDSSQPYPPTGSVVLSPKMDGSLGILYWKNGWRIATRGSFASDQAIHATALFNETKYLGAASVPQPGKTYLFEIIYPENRIVVDYGQDDKLVLLDVIDIETGKTDLTEFDAFEWPDKVEKKLLPGFSVDLTHTIPDGEEGFVLYWPGKDFRVKMKSADYIALHRLIFGLNSRTVWEVLAAGKSPSVLMDGLPDEFHPWVMKVAGVLKGRHSDIVEDVKKDFKYLFLAGLTDPDKPRKEFALAVKDHPRKGLLFSLLDNKSIDGPVWDEIRPAHDEFQLNSQTEDVA